MNLLQEIQKLAMKKKMPVIKPGYTVRVHQRIKEGEKERIQIFEGLVLKTNSGFGADKTITVRKIVEGIGVEKTFPVYSTNIQQIEVTKKSKVRRAKLYYMRERFGKSARLKASFVTKKEMQQDEKADQQEEPAKEEVVEKAEVAPAEEVAAAETAETPAETAETPEKTPEEPQK